MKSMLSLILKVRVIFYLLIKIKAFRNLLLGEIEKAIHKILVENRTDKIPLKVLEMEYNYVVAFMRNIMKNLEKGYISHEVFRKIIVILTEKAILREEESTQQVIKARKRFFDKYGFESPVLYVLSPTQACNLQCPGCYANSYAHTQSTLPYHMIEDIINDTYQNLGIPFMVISGGEPFMYKSEGKTIMDVFEKYKDIYFMVYTNGTLITEEVSDKLAELGNVTVAISVEGYKPETEERRGEGTHYRILQAFDNLKKAGVPFGISVTGSNKNAEILLSDQFYDYYFDELGATYMWQFQIMPIGRVDTAFDLVIDPEKRVELYEKWKEIMEEKKYPVADFWNSGILSGGCIAYGRRGGYFYIDWNGNVLPCVFVPYYIDNVYELYKNGKTIEDALMSNFMKRGRKWQIDYEESYGNGLMPCSIRDHYENFRKNILTDDVKPEDSDADTALKSDEYYEKMKQYDEHLQKLTQKLWEKEYMEDFKKENKEKYF